MDRAATIARPADRPVATLQSIAIAAERVSKVAGRLSEFLDRYYGRDGNADGAGEDPRAAGYRNDLDRLSDALDALECVAGGISEIG
jgi:hypothetical protein